MRGATECAACHGVGRRAGESFSVCPACVGAGENYSDSTMRTVTVTRWIAVGRYGHIKGEYATRVDAERKAYKAAGDTVQRIQYSYTCQPWPADWIPRTANA